MDWQLRPQVTLLHLEELLSLCSWGVCRGLRSRRGGARGQGLHALFKYLKCARLN